MATPAGSDRLGALTSAAPAAALRRSIATTETGATSALSRLCRPPARPSAARVGQTDPRASALSQSRRGVSLFEPSPRR